MFAIPKRNEEFLSNWGISFRVSQNRGNLHSFQMSDIKQTEIPGVAK
jgi:hypothetical protein